MNVRAPAISPVRVHVSYLLDVHVDVAAADCALEPPELGRLLDGAGADRTVIVSSSLTPKGRTRPSLEDCRVHAPELRIDLRGEIVRLVERDAGAQIEREE